jgi:hypothetical protein
LYRWTTLTPDGRRLNVSRESGMWTVVCEGAEARSELLDVALIEAIRTDSERDSDPGTVDYATWIRTLADRLEREAQHFEERRKRETLPNRGDRIELAEGRFGLVLRGTVQYVDQVQVLVKLDDGRSRSLRMGIDGFRIVDPDDTA